MGSRRLITAPTPHALEVRCGAEIVRAQGGDPLRPVVVLVPGNEVATRLRLALHKAHGVRAAVRLWTMRDCARHLAERALRAEGFAPLGPPADALLLETAIAPLAAEPDRPFAPGARQPGFVLALAETFKDLGEAGCDAATLPDASRVAAETARLYRAWRALLAERRLSDTVRLLEAAAEAPVRLPDGATEVVCHGFYDLTGLQRRLLLHLASAVDVTVCVPVAPSAEASRFGEATRAWLAAQGFEPVRAPRAGRARATQLGHLQRRLFSVRGPRARGKGSDGSVVVASVPGGEHEVREVARALLAWRRGGIPWAAMGVLYHGGAETGRAIARVLGGVGVPLAGPDDPPGLPLRTPEDPTLAETAPGRALLRLLALRSSGWKRGESIDALGLVPLRDAGGVAPTARWEALARDAGVVGGVAQWTERLAHHAGECERRAADAAREDEPAAAAAHARAAIDARACAACVTTLAARLAALPAGGPPATLADAVLAFLDATIDDGALDLAGAAELAELRDAVRTLRSAAVAVATLPWERFERLLADTLAGARVRRARARPDGVFVGSLYAARGLPFRAVAIVGLTERRFPPPAREDPLLPDADRRAWAEAQPDVTLAGSERRPDEERMLFGLALAAASEACVLSVPRVDPADGRELVPSLFALQALEALAGRPVREIDPTLPWVRRVPLAALPAERRAEALDLREFDLSVVEAAEATGDGALLGALAEADGAGPAPLRRALAAADARLALPRLTAWDGLLADPAALARVRARADDAGARSPSRLETYAKCPYQYFLHYELGCEAVDEPDETERMHPIDRGHLMHAVLEELVAALAGALPLDAATLPDARARADEILDRRFEAYAARGLAGAPVIGAADRERMRSALHRYVRTALVDGEFLPVGCEVRFGFPSDAAAGAAGSGHALDPGVDAPVVVTLPDDRRLAFRGYIDRVDRSPDGRRLRVVDYKTGWPPDPARVAQGEALQLPVYALAAELAFPGAVTEVAAYHAVHQDPTRAGASGLHGDALAAARRDLLRVAALVDAGVRAGRFHATPSESTCQRCDFVPVCGPGREAVWARKQADPAAAELRALRERAPEPRDA